jgi:hypothetical protein
MIYLILKGRWRIGFVQRIKSRVPVPGELIVVILATTASFIGNFAEKYHLKVAGVIPSGMLLRKQCFRFPI